MSYLLTHTLEHNFFLFFFFIIIIIRSSILVHDWLYNWLVVIHYSLALQILWYSCYSIIYGTYITEQTFLKFN